MSSVYSLKSRRSEEFPSQDEQNFRMTFRYVSFFFLNQKKCSCLKRIQSLKKRARVGVKASLHYKQNTRYLLQIPTAIYHNKKANYMLVFIPMRTCFLLRKVDVFRRSSLLQQFTFRFCVDS